MSIRANWQRSAKDPIRQLYIEAGNSAGKDRRAGVRFSFFRPVTILCDDQRRVSAFSRDISACAIGLMHTEPMSEGEVDLVISSQNGYSVRVRAKLKRCHSCGDQWYTSAAVFLNEPQIVAVPTDEPHEAVITI